MKKYYKMHKSQFLEMDGKKYLFEISNNSVSYSGLYTKKVIRRIRQIWETQRGQHQLIKKYNWCEKNGLDWKKEFKKSNFITA